VSDLDDRVRELEERLTEVEAVQEITRLKARYAELIDSRYTQQGPKPADEVARIADQVVALFAEDAVWDGGADLGCWQGRDEIRKRFLDPTLQFTIHYFVQPRIQINRDRATGRWDILAPVTFGNGKPGWMTGIEDDEYVRVRGRWLHSRMKLTVHFMVPHARGWGGTPGD
jgi:hypothetical protein